MKKQFINAAKQVSKTLWIDKVDDAVRELHGFGVFNLPKAYQDDIFSQYELGVAPEDAVQKVYEPSLILV